MKMKRICFLCLCLGLLLVACGGNTRKESSVADAQEEVAVSDGVEVLYFHGKQRCATCIAIEKGTQEVMEKDLADAVRKGEVKFRTIDISREENEVVAEKYEVTWSSLFVVKHKDGAEAVENLTEFAFGNARKSPEVFKAGVMKTVREMLE